MAQKSFITLYKGAAPTPFWDWSIALNQQDLLDFLQPKAVGGFEASLPNYAARSGNDGVNVGSVNLPVAFDKGNQADYLSFYASGLPNDDKSLIFFARVISCEHVSEATTRFNFEIDAYNTYKQNLLNSNAFLTRRAPNPPAQSRLDGYLFRDLPLPTITKTVSPVKEIVALNASYSYVLLSTTNLDGKQDGGGVGFQYFCGVPFFGFKKVYKDIGALTSDLLHFVNMGGGYMDAAQIQLLNTTTKVLVVPDQIANSSSESPLEISATINGAYQAKYAAETSPEVYSLTIFCPGSGDAVELDASSFTFQGGVASVPATITLGGGLNPKAVLSVWRPNDAGDPFDDKSRQVATLDYPEIPIMTLLMQRDSWLGTLNGLKKIGTDVAEGAVAGFTMARKGGSRGALIGAALGGLVGLATDGAELGNRWMGHDGSSVVKGGNTNALFNFFNGGYNFQVLERSLPPSRQANYQTWLEKNGETCFVYAKLPTSGYVQITGNLDACTGMPEPARQQIVAKLQAGFLQQGQAA